MQRRQVLAKPRERVVESLPLPAPATSRAPRRAASTGRRRVRARSSMGLVVQPEVKAPGELEAGLTAKGVHARVDGRRARARRRDSPAGANPGDARAGAGAGRAALLPDVRNGDDDRAARPPTRLRRRRDEDRARKAPRAGFSSTGAWAAPPTRGRSRRGCSRSAHCKMPWRPEGEKVCYVVRAAASLEPLVESAASNEACLGVRDISPPAAPSGLAVVPRERRPRARLDAVGGGGRRGRIASIAKGAGEPRAAARRSSAGAARPGPTPAAKPGVAYRYSVTAVDQRRQRERPDAAGRGEPAE